MKIGATFYCVFLLVWIAHCSEEAEIVTIDVHAAKNLLNQGHLYLDVRTEEEFKNGHLEGAFNVPYMFNSPKGLVENPKFIDQVLLLRGKEHHFIVGCKSGVRSANAAAALLKAEFRHVYNMGGGYAAWVENGFAVNKPHYEEL